INWVAEDPRALDPLILTPGFRPISARLAHHVCQILDVRLLSDHFAVTQHTNAPARRSAYLKRYAVPQANLLAHHRRGVLSLASEAETACLARNLVPDKGATVPQRLVDQPPVRSRR